MKYILLSIFIFSNFLFSSEVQITSLKNKNPERVLFIGNSYLYYNDSLHNHVRRMLEEAYANDRVFEFEVVFDNSQTNRAESKLVATRRKSDYREEAV